METAQRQFLYQQGIEGARGPLFLFTWLATTPGDKRYMKMPWQNFNRTLSSRRPLLTFSAQSYGKEPAARTRQVATGNLQPCG